MDNYSSGRGYTSRRSIPHIRHTKTPKRGGLGRLLAFQTLVSVILLLIIVIAKSINISAASFITGQVRYVLDHNVELKSIYAFAQTTVSDIKNSIMPGSDNVKRIDVAAEADDYLDKTNAELYASDTGEDKKNDVPAAEVQLAGPLPKTSVLAANSGDVDTYTSDQQGAFGMICPASGSISVPFGEISGPGGFARTHNGIDISIGHVSDVKAALDGIVADSGSAPGYGNYVRLRHDNGLTTVYGNCSSIAVEIDTTIRKGNVIAMVGEDSMAGGSHLHFEVWNGNDPVDPLDYIIVTAG